MTRPAGALTLRSFTTPQTALNAAAIRAERRASRIRLRDIALVFGLCLALSQALRIAIDQWQHLPDVIAQTAERNLP